MHRTSNP